MKDEFVLSKKKSDHKISNALFYCSLISWFLAIWILPYRWQFVLTGIFCFILCLVVNKAEKMKRRRRRKINNSTII